MNAPSDDPITTALDVLGDRWTLLVLRDVVFHDRRHFRALLSGSAEGIASNILADRIKRLLDAGILARGGEVVRGQRAIFHLTEAGIRAVPILYALERWGADRSAEGRRSVGEGDFHEAGLPPEREFLRELRTRHLETPPAGPGRDAPQAVPSSVVLVD